MAKNSVARETNPRRDAAAEREPASETRVKAAAVIIIQLTDTSLCEAAPDVVARVVVDQQSLVLNEEQARELVNDLTVVLRDRANALGLVSEAQP